jgi:hypothetical protein
MDSAKEERHDFIPIASIIAFVFIGVFIVIGLIGRCLALNQSTIRSAQSSDLMIYRPPPKSNLAPPKVRSSTEALYDSVDNREQRISFDDPVPIQRGPKNL